MNSDQLKEAVNAYLSNKQFNKAEALLKPLCTNSQIDTSIWQMYAQLLHMSGNDNFALIEKCFRKIIKLQPNNINALFNLSCALVANGKMNDAIPILQRVLELNPNHSVANDNLGQLYEENGQVEAAKLCYKKAIKGDNVQAVHYRHLGVTYLKSKNPAKAEENFIQAIALNNRVGKTYIELGRAQCELGKIDAAIESFNQALKINPNLNYARFWLSAINDQRSTDQAKHRFVSKLFDGHAEDFDKILVNDLGYKTPWLLAEDLSTIINPDKKLNILDIGCGTGLCADSLKPMINTITGIDLSEKMLLKAKQRGSYKELIHGDIVDATNALSTTFELVVAADVFVYVGGLSEVFESCHAALSKNGLFAFSIELSEHSDDFMLRATGRYAHSSHYIKQLSCEHNFESINVKEVILRMDAGNKILGEIHILRKK